MIKHNIKDFNYIESENKRLEKSSRLSLLQWFVIIASFILTIIAWYQFQNQVKEKAHLEFNRQSEQLISLISERMGKYEEMLWSGVATMHSQEERVDYAQWKRFSDILNVENRYPGINGIGVIYHVMPNEVKEFVDLEHELRPDFKIHPFAQRDEYLPITFIEPVEINKEAVGLDMAHEKNRYEAAIKARDTGEAQVTAPIILVQDHAKTPGYLFYAPFYHGEENDSEAQRKENFAGLIYAPFIMKNLMRGTLQIENRDISLQILDAGEILYSDKENINYEVVDNPHFVKTVVLKKYGRDWEYRLESKDSFHDKMSSGKPIVILFSGVLIDLLLFVIFYSSARSNKRTLAFSQKITGAYQEQYDEINLTRQNLEKSQKFESLIFNSIPSFIFVKDSEYKIIKANDAFINNYPEEERDRVIGYTTVEKYPPHEAEAFLEFDRIAFEEGISATEEKISFPNGDVKTLFTTKIRFSEGGQDYILGISHDITALKAAEKEILRSNIELEKFAYLASHDLQEPIRTVNNFMQIFVEDYEDKFDEQANVYMKHIVDASGRMQEMVSDLLDYSKIQDDNVHLQRVETNNIVQQAIDNLQESVEQTQAQITVQELPDIDYVPMRLMRIFQNLIGNAIKYKARDRDPVILVSCTSQKEEWVFSVADNGIGINEKYKSYVFDIFKRLHNKDEYSGTGIGLTLCEKIVKSMGGRIWFESVEGEGSVFSFSVPRKIKQKDKKELK